GVMLRKCLPDANIVQLTAQTHNVYRGFNPENYHPQLAGVKITAGGALVVALRHFIQSSRVGETGAYAVVGGTQHDVTFQSARQARDRDSPALISLFGANIVDPVGTFSCKVQRLEQIHAAVSYDDQIPFRAGKDWRQQKPIPDPRIGGHSQVCNAAELASEPEFSQAGIAGKQERHGDERINQN